MTTVVSMVAASLVATLLVVAPFAAALLVALSFVAPVVTTSNKPVVGVSVVVSVTMPPVVIGFVDDVAIPVEWSAVVTVADVDTSLVTT
jgi:hypothetical protein